ncbi:glycosyltransferase [Coleofasciculus chthonoplastes]|uniref:glycosyltransferase n=1 Tax=Coleofasciculus chthonoplastes TaxID=64178 RepID=UPI0032F41649
MNVNSANCLLPVPSGSFVVPGLTTVLSTTEAHPLGFSLIIPTYKEAKNLAKLVEQLSRLLDSQLAGDYELIVVDDDSPDDTWKVAQELTADYPQLRVMRRIEERGLSTAVIRGWQVARGEVLGVIDADLQHPPELLLQLWSQIQGGVDLAVASRHVEGGGVSDWSIIRRFLSRGAQMIGLILLPGVIGRVSDPMSGYFMVRRNCLVDRPLNPLGYKILIEVLGRGKIPEIGEVGYVFQERQVGESKVTWKQYVEYLQHLLRLRLSLGYIGRFIRFGLVGFSGVFVDMAIFYLLRDKLGLGLTLSAALSAEVAMFNNFLWNDVWTFGDISQHQPGWRQWFERFVKFNGICLAGLILNVLLVNLLFNVFGINEYVSKLIAIAAVTVWNFWINLKLSWRVTDVRQ